MDKLPDSGPITESMITREIASNLILEHLTIEAAAQAIVHRCVSERYKNSTGVSWYTVRNWIRRALYTTLTTPENPERVNRVAELLGKANIPDEAIGRIRNAKLSSWGYAMKVKREQIDPATGKVIGTYEEPVEGGLYKTEITLNPQTDFPLVQPAPSTILYADPPRILRQTRVEVIISDLQIGYLRDRLTDALEPIHDPYAIDVATQITQTIAPNRIIFIGDVADLAPFSRWQKFPEYRGTIQPAIDATHQVLGTFIAAGGERCERVLIGSNHDHRIEKSVLEWNMEGLGLRRAGDPPDGWPVFSLGFLARFDDLGIEWSGHYPGGEFYILDDLVAMHAPPKAKEFRASVIHGHTHHITRTTQVTHGALSREKRRYTNFVYDVGCLCRVGVTDDKFRLLITHTPSDRGRTDWAQGIGVVSIVEASGSRPAFHSVEQVSIIDGQANFGGQHFLASHFGEAA